VIRDKPDVLFTGAHPVKSGEVRALAITGASRDRICRHPDARLSAAIPSDFTSGTE